MPVLTRHQRLARLPQGQGGGHDGGQQAPCDGQDHPECEVSLRVVWEKERACSGFLERVGSMSCAAGAGDTKTALLLAPLPPITLENTPAGSASRGQTMMSSTERVQPTHSIVFFALSIASGESGPAHGRAQGSAWCDQ